MERPYSTSLLLRWLPLITWGVIVLYLSLIPSPPTINHKFWGWDKFEHAAAYAVLTALAGLAFNFPGRSFRVRWYYAVGVAIGVGALLEVLQGVFTANRTAEFGDLVADAFGSAVVCLGAILIEKHLKGVRKV